jgi:hypothetical protein
VTQAPLTLREHIDAAEKNLSDVPNPAAPKVDPPVADEKVAEQEADSTKPDAELSEAGRKLRGNRLDARKAKLHTEITELNELLRLRKELREQIAPAQAPQQSAPAPPSVVADPRDPEPTFESFVAANPTHPDPYAGWNRALAAWDRRQEALAADLTRQQQQAQVAQRTALSTYESRASEVRAKHSDYDAVTQPFIEQYANHPYSQAVAGFLAHEPLGAQVLYHLAKSPDVANALFAPGVNPFVELGAIKATVLAASRPVTTPVTSAPAPPSQTAGAGATATHDDPNTRSFKDHLRIENEREAERRARGLR